MIRRIITKLIERECAVILIEGAAIALTVRKMLREGSSPNRIIEIIRKTKESPAKSAAEEIVKLVLQDMREP